MGPSVGVACSGLWAPDPCLTFDKMENCRDTPIKAPLHEYETFGTIHTMSLYQLLFGGAGTSYNGLYREAPPPKRLPFSGFRFMKGKDFLG